MLPKLIKLSPNVVKGVFDRIFTSCQGVHSKNIIFAPLHTHARTYVTHNCLAIISGEQSSTCPLTPPDLLIALHNIDCTGDESMMKCVIKGMNICDLHTTVYFMSKISLLLNIEY